MNEIGGPDLLIWLVLAFGGAMFVGNLMALVRPPAKQPQKNPKQSAPLATAPRSRTIAMMAVGAIATVWAIATLLSR